MCTMYNIHFIQKQLNHTHAHNTSMNTFVRAQETISNGKNCKKREFNSIIDYMYGICMSEEFRSPAKQINKQTNKRNDRLFFGVNPVYILCVYVYERTYALDVVFDICMCKYTKFTSDFQVNKSENKFKTNFRL